MNIQLLLAAGLITLLTGCVAPLHPYQVARSCAPPHSVRIEGMVKGNPNYYRQTLQEECGNTTMFTEDGRYGPYRTHSGEYRSLYDYGHTSTSVGPGRYEHEREYRNQSGGVGFFIQLGAP